jgi:hypothetical protein
MTVTIDSFRASFPEFADTTKYPDSQITFWLNGSIVRFDPTLFDDQFDYITSLYVAHNLAVSKRRGLVNGGIGFLSSKSVGPVSAGYDFSHTTIEGGGSYNLTIYGIQLLELIRLFGAGAIQLFGDNFIDSGPTGVLP